MPPKKDSGPPPKRGQAVGAGGPSDTGQEALNLSTAAASASLGWKTKVLLRILSFQTCSLAMISLADSVEKF